MITFEFTAKSDFNFLEDFGRKFKVPVIDNRLTIPASLGVGSIRKVDFDENFRLLIHRYKFKQAFVYKRYAPANRHDNIAIFFYNSETPINLLADKQLAYNNDSSIEIGSSDLNSEIRVPANTEVYFTVVGIKSTILSDLLRMTKPNSIVKTILENKATFIFHESMSPEVKKLLNQLSEINDQTQLDNFYYRIKVEELLYLLFTKLLNREAKKHSLINKTDIESLFAIQAAILADLGLPPQLQALAKMANMSETKMKLLFKQVFGDTIYNYYQKFRMEEAAFLLKHGGKTVSEVGYQLGFSNLSHFSKLFQKHYGTTPKKYSSVA
jgi:AraC-like DNA-binding protein